MTFAMMWTIASGPSTPVASATDPARFTTVDAPISPLETATAMAIKTTSWGFAAVIAQPMPTAMAFVTMWTTAWEHPMPAVSAMDPARSSNVVARTFLQETATVTETKWTPSENAVAAVQLTPTKMASATMWTTASAASMLVAFAMDLARFTTAVARKSPQETVTATETNWTP